MSKKDCSKKTLPADVLGVIGELAGRKTQRQPICKAMTLKRRERVPREILKKIEEYGNPEAFLGVSGSLNKEARDKIIQTRLNDFYSGYRILLHYNRNTLTAKQRDFFNKTA